MIHVTKTFLPPFEEYSSILKRAWNKGWITNNGELLLEFEASLKKMLATEHLYFCSNGTIILQMAIRALDISKEIITTPFSYVATTDAILWERCSPVFVDINPTDFNIDVSKIENCINNNTEAILVTHVYGNPCKVYEIEKLALKYNLKVIYDAAHAFNVQYNGKSLLNYGDISTCSLHATKLLHSVEGGLITINNKDIAEKIMLYRQFGHIHDKYFSMGINAKNSEFHAAMGLAVLPYVNQIMEQRKTVSNQYLELLSGKGIQFPKSLEGTIYNYSYFPVVFESEEINISVIKALEENQIIARRYFFPSLNELPYLNNKQSCPVSENISRCVLSLPLYHDLKVDDVNRICEIILKTLKK